MEDRCVILISALQHYVFCKRQCALIHNEQLWQDNWLTAQGQLLHQRVDSKDPETRKGIRYERAVEIYAPKLGLSGILDLLEKNIETGELKPVEYKKGKPKTHSADLVQLCAQALCLEEMTGKYIGSGALWYWQIRKRVDIPLDQNLRLKTLEIIDETKNLLNNKILPKAVLTSSCKACSLKEICLPEIASSKSLSKYVNDIYFDVGEKE